MHHIWNIKQIKLKLHPNYTPITPPVSESPLLGVYGGKDITSTKKPIIYPSGEIIAHNQH